MIWGIDDSHWQIDIDHEVAWEAGARFSIDKATEGVRHVDRIGLALRARARARGMPGTLFHYFSPQMNGRAQAEHLMKTAGPFELDLPVCIDCEDKTIPSLHRQLITSRLQALVVALRGFKGFPFPMIYTSPGWWNDFTLPWSGWQYCPLMVASWGNHTIVPAGWVPGPNEPLLPRDWKKAGRPQMVWQVGKQAGSLWGAKSKEIDVDVWNEAYPFPVVRQPKEGE